MLYPHFIKIDNKIMNVIERTVINIIKFKLHWSHKLFIYAVSNNIKLTSNLIEFLNNLLAIKGIVIIINVLSN